MGDISEAARAVKDAWTVPGRSPGVHRAWQERLRREWPVLARALDRLAAEQAAGEVESELNALGATMERAST